MKLSVIVPSLDGRVPPSLMGQVKGHPEVEIVSVVGVSPVGKARNEGLRRAKGEYVAWVDSDDEVVLGNGKDEMGNRGWLDEILFNLDLQPQPDVLVFDAYAEGWTSMGDFVYGGTDEGIMDALYAEQGVQSALWRCVTRRSLWEGLSFDETIGAAEDVLLAPQVFYRAKVRRYLPRKLYRYFYHAGSLVNSVGVSQLTDIMRVAFRRYEGCPAECRKAALVSCMHSLYYCLQMSRVGPRLHRVAPEPELARKARRFVRQHLWKVRTDARTRLQYLMAALDCWVVQRFSYWYHFGRKGVTPR